MIYKLIYINFTRTHLPYWRAGILSYRLPAETYFVLDISRTCHIGELRMIIIITIIIIKLKLLCVRVLEDDSRDDWNTEYAR